MTDDLVAFLRACLDEEQAEAEAALKRTTTTRRRVQGQWVEDTVQPPEWRRSMWPPARVLAEVDAKRRILDEHDTMGWKIGDRVHDCQWTERPCTTLRLLALPYADHPDYREEWRP